MLTNREQAVLEAVKALQDKNGHAPTPLQIARELGYETSNHIIGIIGKLVSYGCVERLGKCSGQRTINFLSMVPTKTKAPLRRNKPLPELTEAQKRAWIRDVMGYNKLI